MKLLQSLLLACIAIAGCNTTQKTATSSSPVINQLVAQASPCYGGCPVFKMTINDDHAATYEAIRFNDDQQGQYQATIKDEDYRQLMDLLEKTKFTALENEYKVPMTDMPGMNLDIRFDKDKTKTIRDYGAKGTPELVALYTFIKELRKTQDWKKVN